MRNTRSTLRELAPAPAMATEHASVRPPTMEEQATNRPPPTASPGAETRGTSGKREEPERDSTLSEDDEEIRELVRIRHQVERQIRIRREKELLEEAKRTLQDLEGGSDSSAGASPPSGPGDARKSVEETPRQEQTIRAAGQKRPRAPAVVEEHGSESQAARETPDSTVLPARRRHCLARKRNLSRG